MKRIFHGRIDEGKIVLRDKNGFSGLIKSLESKDVEITLAKAKKDRTSEQNKYYWGCVVAMLAEAAGYDPEEMHEALKIKFLSTHVESTLPTVRSTTELSTLEMHEYIERIRRMAAEFFGLNIPDPGCAE